VIGDVKVELGSSICVPTEIEWIRSLPASQQTPAVTLIFSAKEAFYKCQYPMICERLDFHDVAVEAARWGDTGGIFRIRATRSLAILAHTAMPADGRYLFHEGFVTAGMSLGPKIRLSRPYRRETLSPR
jgi:4'-phosphopantetheinyl transferase EntD